MRYAGQGSEVVVPLPDGDLPDDAAAMLQKGFEEVYSAQYTHNIPNAEVEVVSWSETVSAPVAKVRDEVAEVRPHSAEAEGRRQIIDPQTGAVIELDVYWRDALAPGAVLVQKRLAYMRYAGQGSEVVVPLPDGDLPDDAAALLQKGFEEVYAAQYTHKIPNAEVEVVSWSVTVSSPEAEVSGEVQDVTSHRAEPEGRRQIIDPQTGAAIELDVYWREKLAPGALLDGPAVVAEDQTSSLIPAGFRAAVDAFGHLEIMRV
jgi:N-methylhydantoinase A/oxoprolinase/acetone carboxylase beta subunit